MSVVRRNSVFALATTVLILALFSLAFLTACHAPKAAAPKTASFEADRLRRHLGDNLARFNSCKVYIDPEMRKEVEAIASGPARLQFLQNVVAQNSDTNAAAVKKKVSALLLLTEVAGNCRSLGSTVVTEPVVVILR